MQKIISLRRYGSRSVKTFIKRNGSYTEAEILMLLLRAAVAESVKVIALESEPEEAVRELPVPEGRGD